ncbi:GNAT family N-acetyltransferase [Moraxella lacunata]|uniref:N-acetyltransferase n=1 Tax=Moraxella lacunata TaxID=477 RepID=A0A1V4H1T9_MORLA|nr:GNAT family N-acetyltransferase [Moraxella lacunata]OPH38650.1 N-acetyltransferase [Moraxella lacunata]
MNVQRLDKHHDRQSFDCGQDDINTYLKTLANQHTKKNIAKIHVLTDADTPNQIIGFYSLSNTELIMKIKGYPNKIPAILIGKLGVDKAFQGQGLSKVLLSHALNKAKQLSLDTGIAFVIIDAKNDELARYYQRFGFLPTDIPYRLILPIDTILN